MVVVLKKTLIPVLLGLFVVVIGLYWFRAQPQSRSVPQPKSLSLSGSAIRDFKPSKSANRYSLLFRTEGQLFSIDPATERRNTVVSYKLNKKGQEVIEAGRGAIAFLKGTKFGPKNKDAIYVSDYPANNLDNLPITAKVTKDWDVLDMNWSPDMQSLAVLAKKHLWLDRKNQKSVNKISIGRVYETVVIDFKNNKLQLIDRFTFKGKKRDYISLTDRDGDDYVLSRWTSSGIVIIIGKRVVKVTRGGRKIVMRLKDQPLVSAAISPNGKRIAYEAVNRAWVTSIKSGAKARLVMNQIFPAKVFDLEHPEGDPSYFYIARIGWISNKRAFMFVPDEKKGTTRVFEFASSGKFRLKKTTLDSVVSTVDFGRPKDVRMSESPDGKYIYTGRGVWYTQNFTERRLPKDKATYFAGWIALD